MLRRHTLAVPTGTTDQTTWPTPCMYMPEPDGDFDCLRSLVHTSVAPARMSTCTTRDVALSFCSRQRRCLEARTERTKMLRSRPRVWTTLCDSLQRGKTDLLRAGTLIAFFGPVPSLYPRKNGQDAPPILPVRCSVLSLRDN